MDVSDSTLPQSTVHQHKLSEEREIDKSHRHGNASDGRAAAQDVAERQRQQKERVAEVYAPDDGEKVDTEGIYDVPSSILRSIRETIEEEGSVYDQLISVSSHVAKIADESQKTVPSTSGWGYAEIKEAMPSVPTASAIGQAPSHLEDRSSTTSSLHYADITDSLSSKQPSFTKQLQRIDDLPDVNEMHGSLNSDTIASLTSRNWDGPSSRERNSTSEEKVVQLSINDSDRVKHVERVTPTSPPCQEIEQSSEISDSEEVRNMTTPEGSEGSDVFVEQLPVTMTTKSNSLPPLMSHQTHVQLLGGRSPPPQRGTVLTTANPRHNRARIVSEPQPTTKPKPAKRTRISNDQPSTQNQDRLLSQQSGNSQVKLWQTADLPLKIPQPALPEKLRPLSEQHETPPPPLPEKPVPTLPPDEPPPALPAKPPPVLPDRFPPTLPDKPPSVLPDKPPPALPDKPPPALPDKPVWEGGVSKSSLLEHQKHLLGAIDSPIVGRYLPKVPERPPVPKPRRNFQSTSSNDSPVQVRSARSHTTATCSTQYVDNNPSVHPSAHQSKEANGGGPKAVRSTRAKSSSDSWQLGTGECLDAHRKSVPHVLAESTRTVGYDNVVSTGKAAPPVARKPKPTSTSSPGSAFNRREQSGPPTSPKPKRN